MASYDNPRPTVPVPDTTGPVAKDNLITLDELVNSNEETYTNRFGRESPTLKGITSGADAVYDEIRNEAESQRDQFDATFQAQFTYKRIGNISDYVGNSLPEADKLNSYQFPDDSGEWYGPIQSQSFPVTIPADPSGDSGWALTTAATQGWVADTVRNPNLLSNHNFLTPSPDDIAHPSATPTDYAAGTQIFSGVFVESDVIGLTYINGRVKWTNPTGAIYLSVPNTNGLEYVTEFTASVADFDGKPRARGVSFALVGDEYRVTVGIDALSDGIDETLLGSVKFEQGKVATGHDIQFPKGQTYTFNTVSEMVAIGAPIGAIVDTKGYWSQGDGGGARYIVKPIPDDVLAHLDAGTTPFTPVKLNDWVDDIVTHRIVGTDLFLDLLHHGTVNAKQCGAVADAFSTSSDQTGLGWAENEEAVLLSSHTDNHPYFQAMIDYVTRIPVLSPIAEIPAGSYAIHHPILVDHADGLLLEGAGKLSTCIVPVAPMTPVLNDYFQQEQARLDLEFTDPTDPGIRYDLEKCVFMFTQGRRNGANYNGRWRRQTGNAQWSVTIRDMGMSGGYGVGTESFVYAPELAQSLIDNCYVENAYCLLKVNDLYRFTMRQCEISGCWTPVDHFSTISEANAQATNPEATSNATGTSVHIDGCGAHNLGRGWSFVHIPYSTFSAVAVDNWSEKASSTTEIASYAYDFERCAGLVLNGCGAEDFSDNKASGLFKITGGDEGTTIINGGVYVHPGNPVGTTGEVFLLDGLSLELNSCTISTSAGIAIQRGEVFIQGTSGVSLDSFRNKTAYTQIYDGMPITNSRFIPTINGVGKQKFSLFRVVQATQTVTQDLTNGYKVILDTNDSVRGFETQEYEAMQPSKDTIRIPYKGVFSVDICISHNALITNEVRLIKESPEGVRTKMIKYVTDSASRGIGEKTFSITAPFGQYDLVYLEIPQIASPGTIYTVTTSVYQI